MKIDLKNNIVLVTGGTSGIGKSAVQYLSEAGASIALHYSKNKETAERIQKSLKGRVEIFKADLSDARQTKTLFNQVISKYGRIDTLINNAGVYLSSPIEKETDSWLSDWNKTMHINLTAAGLLCKMSIPIFKETGGGRIINIASRAAFRGDTDEYFAYAASKGGLVSLTKTIARSFGKQNIKAFAVAPGWVKTQMAEEFINKYGESYVLKELALPQLTLPDDVAPTIVFLASGMMDHATGSTVDINAGSYNR